MNLRTPFAGILMIATGTAPMAVSAHDMDRPVPVKTEHHSAPEVRFWKTGSWNIQPNSGFVLAEKPRVGGGNLASGDIDGDGTEELVVGADQGGEPWISIYRQDGTKQGAFLASRKTFTGGIRVAVGDVDGDGVADIITAQGPGAEPKINIFHADGSPKFRDGVLAYAAAFTGGVHVATVDMNRDGKDEIVTSPGPGGGPHVRVWDGEMQNLGLDFFAYDHRMTDGVEITSIRSPEGGSLVTAIESWDMPLVKTYVLDEGDASLRAATEFLAYEREKRNGIRVAAFDMDADGYDEIAVVRNGGEWPEVKLFDRYGTVITKAILTDPGYRDSFSMVGVTDPENGRQRLATLPLRPVVSGPTDTARSIEVDLSEQRLYAYERGRLARTFLVSTGTTKYPTPEMETTVLKKIPIMDYRWSYGPGNPDNYFLPGVKYNLNIRPHYYIHYAYWHNNFGHRMSHGCVNVGLADAQWIYDWAEVGTPVSIVP